MHLSGRDVADAVLKANGVTKQENVPLIHGNAEVSSCDVDSDMLDALVEEKLKKMMMKLLA